MDNMFCFLVVCFVSAIADVTAFEVSTVLPVSVEAALNKTRRVLNGREVTDSRPYMVYLKLPQPNTKHANYRNWLCGGVIVDEEYIITSAACVQDAEHFYVVSGTYRYNSEDGPDNNDCIKYGRKKAVWKCVPKNYVYDGYANDNIRWLYNDIAVVKVEEPFSFEKKVKGCDFVPQAIAYNNRSVDLEEPGTKGSVAGWGRTKMYQDLRSARREHHRPEDARVVLSKTVDRVDDIPHYTTWYASLRQGPEPISQNLMEADVELVEKEECKKRWGSRYKDAIESYMICSSDASHDDLCEKHANCENIKYEDAKPAAQRREGNETVSQVAQTNQTSSNPRRAAISGRRATGGFCENDHGGPLVHGYGTKAVVIGLISAALVKDKTNECYGPFLYTSIFTNRIFINCAVFKQAADSTCLLRFRPNIEETTITWAGHPDGPAKNEIRKGAKSKY